MKKLFALFFASMMGYTLHAESEKCVVIHADNTWVAFRFDQKPKVTLDDKNVILACNDGKIFYALDKNPKILFEDVDTGTSVDGVMDGRFRISDKELSAQGCESMHLYGLDGKLILSSSANAEGSVSISIANLPKNVYIVKAGKTTFKFTKK